MRITILSGSVPTTTFIDALVNTMAEEGYHITLIGKRTGTYNYHKNVAIVIVPDGYLARLVFIARLLLFTGFKQISKILENSKGVKELYNNLLYYLPIIHSRPDKIHLQWTAFVHNKDLLFKLFADKVVVSLRGAHINYTPVTTPEIKESYLRLLPKVHRFHAVSKAILKEAEQYGVSSAKTDVIYSMVSDALLEKQIIPKEKKDKLQVISVGRFFWKKGYNYAIDAMYKLKQRGVSFRYTLIAEGEMPASIKYHIHQLGLDEDIHIVNGTTHEQVLEQIEHHDVLLLPSVEEGIANVVLEAMATGTPVITTDVGGMCEVAEHNISALVVPVRDVVAMSDALVQFNSMNSEERYAMATTAKNKITKQHNKQEFTERFKQFYNS